MFVCLITTFACECVCVCDCFVFVVGFLSKTYNFDFTSFRFMCFSAVFTFHLRNSTTPSPHSPYSRTSYSLTHTHTRTFTITRIHTHTLLRVSVYFTCPSHSSRPCVRARLCVCVLCRQSPRDPCWDAFDSAPPSYPPPCQNTSTQTNAHMPQPDATSTVNRRCRRRRLPPFAPTETTQHSADPHHSRPSRTATTTTTTTSHHHHNQHTSLSLYPRRIKFQHRARRAHLSVIAIITINSNSYNVTAATRELRAHEENYPQKIIYIFFICSSKARARFGANVICALERGANFLANDVRGASDKT